MRRLDIGICSYGTDPAKLMRAVESVKQHSVTDWRCFVIHNPSDGDERTREFISKAAGDPRIVPVWMPENAGYVGAVNELFRIAESEYIAYMDFDAEVLTPGWDGAFCALLDAHPKVAQVFPGSGHYGFHNGEFNECLWNAGYFWMIRGSVAKLHPMDVALGHHEEVDLMIRLRLSGHLIACIPSVSVAHHETSTASPASAKRIHAGVVRWMNKWNRYFCGDALVYPNPDPDSGEGYDPRCLRYTDWPPCALYLERMTLALFPEWNRSPRTVAVPGSGEMDAIEILKPKGCYVGRAI